MTALPSAYAQLLGLGVLWVSFHCSGMCGPLLVGLDLAGAARGWSPWRGALQVLSYQAGRALTYAWLGGLCGLLGARLNIHFTKASALLAMACGLLTLAGVLRPVGRAAAPVKLRRPASESGLAPLLAQARRVLTRLAGHQSPLHGLALGSAMGFLPCMLMLWALGLAALTASPLHGALVMLLLVAMTTPVLLTVTLLPHLLRGRRRGASFLAAYLPALSGLWLVLCGGAAVELWPHVHTGLSVLGRPFTVMLF